MGLSNKNKRNNTAKISAIISNLTREVTLTHTIIPAIQVATLHPLHHHHQVILQMARMLRLLPLMLYIQAIMEMHNTHAPKDPCQELIQDRTPHMVLGMRIRASRS